MGCGGKTTRPRNSQRKTMLAMHARLLGSRGREAAAAALSLHRLNQCCHASTCGRLCPHLIKGPGIEQIRCEHRLEAMLYDLLEDPEFTCPEGLF